MRVMQKIRKILTDYREQLTKKRVIWVVIGVPVALVILLILLVLQVGGDLVFYIFILVPGTVIILGIWVVLLRKTTQNEDADDSYADHMDQVEGCEMPVRYNYGQLRVATMAFKEKLGAGGFGSVFRGTLANGQEIAVKCLEGSGQGMKEFAAEVRTIGSIHHINLVKLIGFCAEKSHRALVYEFMCNGSLDKWIFSSDPKWPLPNWKARRSIILRIAKGLAYLHEECSQKIAHLDIKPQNILLDENFNAKISDFGMSRLIERDKSQVMTKARGTVGYMAPEVFHRAAISVKADVYSFGVVVMEVVCGRRNLDGSDEDLVSVLMAKAKEEAFLALVEDGSADMKLHMAEAEEMLRLAVWCLQSSPIVRPQMSTVVKVLEGTLSLGANFDFNNESLEEVVVSIEPSVLSGPR